LRVPPGLLFRFCLGLLLGTVALALISNLSVLRGKPLLPETTAVRSPSQPLRFVIVAPQSDHPFWEAVRDGARQAAGGRSIDVEFSGPRRASLEEQANLLHMATAAQVDGIITQGVPEDPQIAEAIYRAIDTGIPVVTVDVDQPLLAGRTNSRLTYIGSDNYAAGRAMAEELIRRSGGKADVGIVRGGLGSGEHDLRVQGFRDRLAVEPGIRIVAVESSGMNRTVAAEKALQMKDRATAFYGTTALDAVGIAHALRPEPSRRRLVFGFDDVADAEEYLLRGQITAVIHQEPEEMGRSAVTVLEDYLREDKRPDAFIHTPFSIRRGGDGR